MKTEKRIVTFDNISIRQNADGGHTLIGHAAVFGVFSKPVTGARGRFVERIRPGTFKRALDENQDVRCLVNHETSKIMGRTVAGTLRLKEDEQGLSVECDLGERTYEKDLRESVERGEITEMSFAFKVVEGGERFLRRAGPDGLNVRELTDVDLFDVSPVTYAQYPDTSIAVRSYDMWSEDAEHEENADLEGTPPEDVGPLYSFMPDALQSAAVAVPQEHSDLEEGEERSCFLSHMDMYAMEPARLEEAVALAQRGMLPIRADHNDEGITPDSEEDAAEPKPYLMENGGVAVIDIDGAMAKHSKFGASTVRIRRAIRTAVEDPQVKGILIRAETPGGQAAGTDELATAIREAGAVKPTHGFGEDMVASAGYWALSQCQRISVNAMCEVGSIGVVAALYDQSGAFKKAGIKVNVIRSGKDKALGQMGEKHTKRMNTQIQERVNQINEAFQSAVIEARNLTKQQARRISTGRMFPATKAMDLGLIDAVATYDQAVQAVATAAARAEPPSPQDDATKAAGGTSGALARKRLGLRRYS